MSGTRTFFGPSSKWPVRFCFKTKHAYRAAQQDIVWFERPKSVALCRWVATQCWVVGHCWVVGTYIWVAKTCIIVVFCCILVLYGSANCILICFVDRQLPSVENHLSKWQLGFTISELRESYGRSMALSPLPVCCLPNKPCKRIGRISRTPGTFMRISGNETWSVHYRYYAYFDSFLTHALLEVTIL